MRSAFGRGVFACRGAIERTFGALTSFGGGLSLLPSWVRHLNRVWLWVSAKLGMVQKRLFSGNTRDLSADPDRSRVRAGLRECLVAVLGLQVRENRVYPKSSSQ